MNSLDWIGPVRLRDLVARLLETPRDYPWPPSGAGVYVVTVKPWRGAPKNGPVLYTGAGGNLLDRLGDLTRDLLGFWNEQVGAHSGAQSLWNYCYDRNLAVGDLYLGWAGTTAPCHWCTEKAIAEALNPAVNRRRGKSTCLCAAGV